MKKIYKFIIAIILCVVSGLSFTACCKNELDIDIYMPDGAPALAMAKLIYKEADFGEEIDYNVVASTNIGNYIIQKKADIAIVPINMASKLIGSGEDYKMLASVTQGNLYIVANEDISNLSNLNGKVIGVIGEGNVPDLNLKYLLTSNQIEFVISDTPVANKVAIKYFSSASDLLPMLKTNNLSFGLLPEPAVSKLLLMAPNFNIELDIQELWEGGCYPQAVLIAKNYICEKTKFINKLIDAMKENEEWVLENSSKAVDAINNELEDGVTASLQNTISRTAIENCNIKIKVMTETEVARIKDYLEAIRTIQPKAIGDYTDNMFCEL